MSDPHNNAFRAGGSRVIALRIASAAIGIPILLAVLWIGFWAIVASAVIAAAVAGVETARLIDRKASPLRALTTYGMGLATVPLATTAVFIWARDSTTAATDITVALAIATAMTAIASIVFMLRCARSANGCDQLGAMGTMFGIYFALTLSMAPMTVALDDGAKWLALMMFAVFASDTGAYMVGKSIGARRLAPAISPGKTWEGFFGGISAGMLASGLLAWALNLDVGFIWSLMLGAAISVIGVAGDLLESLLKRRASVKDTGSIMPGHGGILDRADSLAPNFLFIYFVAWNAT